MIQVSAATRSFPGESVSGDGWQIDRSVDGDRIAVIDGLGHGIEAAAAAAAALATLTANPDLDPSESLRACHLALRGTRGAAMTVARIDPEARRLTCVGIGNVDALLIQGGSERRISSDRGIVGAVFPTLHPFEAELAADWLIILHTDGISAHFGTESGNWPGHTSPQTLADTILQQHGRLSDDATVVVITPGHALPTNG